MPSFQTVPCVNINDEFVDVVSIDVKQGKFINSGDVVATVETDKSMIDVVAEQDGYVLRVDCEPGQKIRVGAVMFWLGATRDEAIPEETKDSSSTVSSVRQPTAKARAMLKELDIDPARVPASGERLSVADIEAWLSKGGKPGKSALSTQTAIRREDTPAVAGDLQELSPEAAGMLHTVAWHRDFAASAYLEVEYDPKPWEERAATYAAEHKLMLSPLLPLMAFRLAELGRERPLINSTIVNGQRFQYTPVNIGFTVQAGSMLYLTVVRDTQDMDAAQFISALGEVQRHAMAHKLPPQEASGATLSFSSMARWNVSRHTPILPPQTSLIIAHAAPKNSDKAVLGATYDHRVLTGFDVAQVLLALSRPA
ncbi:2-oxo acid dehydrogenase subunit E2 [Methylomonas sp. MO1]|uniref:2-oxo acid dehydrogenase subunit E2 n=1 Tax=Methylomonas sp. MO1 TaxID=3073619 RepID=UPI0028A491BA|nr:2-oxo acid dehydrogenase subunit E2 [Methylomonas sp. MO1]MDT4290120.1 2-oxo acid dehydrogenase subunit E2 [Methylomonas sp. MO1]